MKQTNVLVLFARKQRGRRAFSLVEVVLALGIVSFAGIALVGLFSIGLSTNSESVEELAATHITQSLLSMRRASPLADIPNFALPPLDQAASVTEAKPAFLSEEGVLLPNADGAKFALIYQITPDGNPHGVSKVYACLYWPAHASAQRSKGRYESFTILPRP